MLKIRNIFQLNLYVGIFIFGSTIFGNAFSITLDEAIEKTLDSSDEIVKINSNLSSITANKTSNFGKTFLPEVYLTYNKIDGSPDSAEFFNESERAFVASYNISNLYKGSFGYLSQNFGLNARKFNSEQEKNDLIIKVIKAYLKVLETTKSIELFEKSLALNQKMLDQTNEKLRVGSTKRTSVLLIESQVEELLAKLELTKSQLIIDKNEFFQIVGQEPENLVEPSFPKISFANFEQFLENVEKNNLKIKASENLKISSKYDLAYTSSEFLPDIQISYNKYSVENNFFTDRNESGSRVMVTAKFYLYKPGLISSVVQKGYDYRSSKHENSINFKQITTTARDLWSKYQYYNTIVSSKERLVKVRINLLKDYQEDYKYGRVELTDTLDEERKLTEAELDLLSVKFEKMLNIFEMRSISGESIF